MAIVFVFTDEEEKRAKEMGVNHMRLYGTTEKALIAMLDDMFVKILMPFLSDEKEREKFIATFHNQVAMRKIWLGE